jgi:hypothetical protein
VAHLIDERPAAPGQADQTGQTGRGGQRHWSRWVLLSVLVLAVVAGAVIGLSIGAGGWRPAVPSPVARPAATAGAGPQVVRVLASTGQVRSGPSFPAVNGIVSGLGSLWLTGGGAGRTTFSTRWTR